MDFSIDSMDSSSNQSFANLRSPRRISKNEPPSFSHFHYSPPHPNKPNLHASPLSTHSSSNQTSHTPTSLTGNSGTMYCCLSSVLKKHGQVLSMTMLNGLIYTGTDANLIRIWRSPEFTECGQLKTKARNVVALQVTRDRLYAAYCDGRIRVWRKAWDGGFKYVRLATIPKVQSYVRGFMAGKNKTMKHMGPITSLAINNAVDVLYSASLDKTVKVWQMSDFKCIETFQAHPQPINDIVIAEDGALYTASDDATVRIWHRNFHRGDLYHSLCAILPANHSPVKALTLVTNKGVLYGGCTDGYVHYWIKNWLSGQLQYGGALQGHTHAIMCITNVSNYVISGSADSTSRVWKRESDGQHTCLAILVGHRGPIKCVTAFVGKSREDNDDGCTICTGSLDGVIKMWLVMSPKKDNGYLTRSDYEYLDM